MSWNNPDGLVVKFAGDYRSKKVNKARAVDTDGLVKQIVFDYDLTKLAAGTTSFTADLNNDGTNDGFTTSDVSLPIGATVLRTTLSVSEAATGGTSVVFGTFREDGTAIDADGLLSATLGVVANLTPRGTVLTGDGAQTVPASGKTLVVSNTYNAYLGLGVVGTFTAGKGRILVEYVTS